MSGLVAQFLNAIRVSADTCPLLPLCGRCERDFFARICVELREPVVACAGAPTPSLALIEGGLCMPDPVECPMLGYFVEIGIRAAPEQVMGALASAITDGEIHWGNTEWREASVDRSMPRRIRTRIERICPRGVWYRSNPDYFSDWRGALSHRAIAGS